MNHPLSETCQSGPLSTFGDGICNDETNNAVCSFDQGDCCLSPVNTDYCSDCSCAVEGVITSPGFPQFYDRYLYLDWLIQLPIGQHIEISYVSFDVGLQSPGFLCA